MNKRALIETQSEPRDRIGQNMGANRLGIIVIIMLMVRTFPSSDTASNHGSERGRGSLGQGSHLSSSPKCKRGVSGASPDSSPLAATAGPGQHHLILPLRFSANVTHLHAKSASRNPRALSTVAVMIQTDYLYPKGRGLRTFGAGGQHLGL